MAQLRGGQAIVESLLTHGVDTVFGIISIHTMDIFDALFDRQDAIRFISTRHEQAAAFMADGYARATGRPGVCLTSTGPGAANSMGGMGEAYTASSPVLNVTSTGEEALHGRGLGLGHEMKDQLGMFASVTQWGCHVSRPEELPDRIHEAFERFQAGRPRPIVIEVPVNVQAQSADMEIHQSRPMPLQEGDSESVRRAANLLLSGERVAIWAGNGVHRSGAAPELVRLAETLGLPVLTTAAGKGAIPDDHPLALGVFGRFQGGWTPGKAENPLRAFFDSLDGLLVVGSSLAYSRTKAMGLELPTAFVQVDIDDESIGKLYKPQVGIVGDAKAVLGQLRTAIQGKSTRLAAGFDREIQSLKDALMTYWEQAMPNEMRAMEAIRSVAARDAIFVGDATTAVHRGATWCLKTYGSGTYMATQWLGLGFAFPAAAGAKAGLPDRQVICLTGDGGFQFNIQELATCVQYGLNPVVLLFNDNAWGVLRDLQRDAYKGRLIGSELKNPDFVKLAESYGVNVAQASSVEEMVPAMESALRSDTVSVIEVLTPDGFSNFK